LIFGPTEALEFDTNSRQEFQVILEPVFGGPIIIGILQHKAQWLFPRVKVRSAEATLAQ